MRAGVKQKKGAAENRRRDRTARGRLGVRILKGLVEVSVSAKVSVSRRERRADGV